tara:strand:- start:1079 stop:1843 length:765 start_codon:yes stop_codon:yes gene_type:complete
MQISKSVYTEKRRGEFKDEDGLKAAWIMLLDVLVGNQKAAAFLSAMQRLGFAALTVSGPRFFWSDDGKEKAVEMSKDPNNEGHALEDQDIPKILDQLHLFQNEKLRPIKDAGTTPGIVPFTATGPIWGKVSADFAEATTEKAVFYLPQGLETASVLWITELETMRKKNIPTFVSVQNGGTWSAPIKIDDSDLKLFQSIRLPSGQRQKTGGPGITFAKAKAHAKRIKLLAKTQISREIEHYTTDDRQWPNEMDDI